MIRGHPDHVSLRSLLWQQGWSEEGGESEIMEYEPWCGGLFWIKIGLTIHLVVSLSLLDDTVLHCPESISVYGTNSGTSDTPSGSNSSSEVVGEDSGVSIGNACGGCSEESDPVLGDSEFCIVTKDSA